MHKIEHNLSKRAQILQGQRQRSESFIPFSLNHQVIFPLERIFWGFLMQSLLFFSLANPNWMKMMIPKKVKKNLEQ